MATAAITLPKTRRRPRNVPAAGRANFPEFYFVKHIDNSRLVREVDVERRRECFSLLGLGVLVFLFVLMFAWQHFQCVRYGYQIEQLKAEYATLEEQNHHVPAGAGGARRPSKDRHAGADPARDGHAQPATGDSGGRALSRRRTPRKVRNWHATSPWVAETLHTSHSYNGPTQA